MKKSLLSAICILQISFLFYANTQAQTVSISDDGTAALPSAMLEIKVSGPNKKGLLIPRMTSAQRTGIASPAKGLLVYDSTNKNFFFHNGAAWMPLSSGVPNSWNISTTNIFNNNIGNVGIGLSAPKTKLHVGPNKTVLFGADTLSSVGGAQFVWFATKGALRFRKQYNAGTYPEPLPYNYDVIGENSLAIGESVAKDNALALGNASFADRDGFAQGFGCFTGLGGFARGAYATAIGQTSFASGLNIQSLGAYSFAYGSELKSKAAYCMVIGSYNDPVESSNESMWVPKDPIFIIGNGGGSGLNSNAFVVLKNSVTGIGFTPTAESPSWGMLQVKNTAGKDHLSLVQNTTSNRWGASVPDGGTADLFLKYNGVNKGKFSSVNGAYTLVSDIRLKKDIVPLSSEVLSKIMQLKAYEYHYIDNKETDPLSHGFIAQEVAKIFPSFVSTVAQKEGEDMQGIDYTGFTVMAIKGIQEQQELIQRQRELIEKQQRQIDEITKRLEALEGNSK